MKLPAFGPNDWFILASLTSLAALVYLLPRRFPLSVSAAIYVFCFTVSISSDLVLGTPPFDLYDINDTPKYTLADFFTWNLYPPFGYLFLYGYDRFRVREIAVPLYILIWAAAAAGYERLSVQVGIFKYKDWTLAYSFAVYLFVLTSYILVFHFIMSSFRKANRKAAAGSEPQAPIPIG